MRILAFDTATTSCSAAVWVDGRVTAERASPMERGHAEALLPMVLATMAEAEAGFGDIDLVAVTIGPGTFTGIRVGLAAARGIALAARLPCVGVGTLEVVAEAVPTGQRLAGSILAVIDTRRGDLFAQCFANDGAPLGEAEIVALDQLSHLAAMPPVLVAGDAAEPAVRRLAEGGVAARAAASSRRTAAATTAVLAARRWNGCSVAPAPVPHYLRPPAVSSASRHMVAAERQ